MLTLMIGVTLGAFLGWTAHGTLTEWQDHYTNYQPLNTDDD